MTLTWYIQYATRLKQIYICSICDANKIIISYVHDIQYFIMITQHYINDIVYGSSLLWIKERSLHAPTPGLCFQPIRQHISLVT